MAVWVGGGGSGGDSGGEGRAGCLLDAVGCCAAPCPPSPRTVLTCSDSPSPGWAEAKAEAGLAKRGGASWDSTCGRGFSGANILLLGLDWDWELASATAGGAARCLLSGLAPVEGGAAGKCSNESTLGFSLALSENLEEQQWEAFNYKVSRRGAAGPNYHLWLRQITCCGCDPWLKGLSAPSASHCDYASMTRHTSSSPPQASALLPTRLAARRGIFQFPQVSERGINNPPD